MAQMRLLLFSNLPSMRPKVVAQGLDRCKQMTTDLMSFDILPLDEGKSIGVKELLSLRENEKGFLAVRRAVTDCQKQLEDDVKDGANRKNTKTICQAMVERHLDEAGGKPRRVVKFLNANRKASTVASLAMGALMIPTAGISAIGVVLPALVSPAIADKALEKANPETRALAQLQALL